MFRPLLLFLLMAAGTAPAGAAGPLPANRWTALPTEANGFQRPQHAGLAYDSRRRRLLVFGSDTHGRHWDNGVWACDLGDGRWRRLDGPPSKPASYRVTPEGVPVAGDPEAPRPWAMHTYDGLVYDPVHDQLVVAADPAHNPRGKKLAYRLNPVWRFDLGSLRWRFDPPAPETPRFFNAVAAWDSLRTIPVLGRFGLWEPDPAHGGWRKVGDKPPPIGHSTLVHDDRRQQFALFGHSRLTNEVWIYHPGRAPATDGRWERRTPGGDPAPYDQHIPAAFASGAGLYVLVIDDNTTLVKPNGRRKLAEKPRRSLTFLYDPDADRYLRLPGAELPPQGMNFMMTYDPGLDAVLLVTGDWRHPVQLLALRVDPAALHAQP